MKIEEIYNEWKSLFPLSEKQTQLLRKKFTTEYNFNSNHIEGNTLTYGQTELLLLFGKVSGEGDLKDFVECRRTGGEIITCGVGRPVSLPLYTHTSFRGRQRTHSTTDGELYHGPSRMANDCYPQP